MSTTLTRDEEKAKRSKEESAQRRGFSSVEEMVEHDEREAAKRQGFRTYEDYQKDVEDYARSMRLKRKKEKLEDPRTPPGEKYYLRQEIEEEERALKREASLREGLADPRIQEKRRELQRRAGQSVMLGADEGRQIQNWEKEARKQASMQREQVLGRARAMGLSAAQMEALNQGLQQTDAEFERQVRQGRFSDKQAAAEELDVFEQAIIEKGAQALASQEQLAFQREKAEADRSSNLWGSIFSGLSTLAAAALPIFIGSDERMKSDVNRGKTKNAAYDFLENLDVAQYKMPGSNTPEMGVMAQSMEKTPLGQQAVEEVGGVKGVNVNEAFKSLIVAQKEMHDRIKKLEGK